MFAVPTLRPQVPSDLPIVAHGCLYRVALLDLDAVLDFSLAMSAERYLLIDAYNVICATEHLRAALRGNMDSARDALGAIARDIHDAEGIRVALILDSRSDRLQVEHPYGSKRFEYIYAPSALTADGVIERIVGRVRDPAHVSVVSNDNLVREATRASGAMALRPEEFFEWARACGAQLSQMAQRRSRSHAKNFENRLDLNF